MILQQPCKKYQIAPKAGGDAKSVRPYICRFADNGYASRE